MLTQEQLLELRNVFNNRISTQEKDLQKHAGQLFYISKILPDAICYADSKEDVIKMVDFCIKHKIPLIPYGSGTSVEGHISPIYGGICCLYAA